MAKKNSSKTATEKAIQSSEPRVLSYRNWNGVSYADVPLTYEPLESGRYDFRQTNLPKNYLMLQNNIVTTDTLSLETRDDSRAIGICPDPPNGEPEYNFTGVCHLFHKWLFCVVRQNNSGVWKEHIVYRDITATGSTTWGDFNGFNQSWDYYLDKSWFDIRELKALTNADWTDIDLVHSDSVSQGNITSATNLPYYEITEIGTYEDNLIVTVLHETQLDRAGIVFVGKLNYDSSIDTIDIKGDNWFSFLYPLRSNTIFSNPTVSNPSTPPSLQVYGMSSGSTSSEGNVDTDTGAITDAHVVRVEVCYTYTTRFGSTLSSNPATIFTEFSPTLWSSANYLKIYMENDTNVHLGTGITGIDFYARDTENTDWVFAGHINVNVVSETSTSWSYHWYGNMTDISQWTTSQLTIPTQNDTSGPSVAHFDVFDSRLYYWGDYHHPYRLYIGGNPGAELSTARGLGGAWVDIEPGSGYDIKGLAKWKTSQGANIITIMCGNSNTSKVARFNLVETNITITNEISYKGYMYERVSNVVGCNSRYGFGVFEEGLYSFSRYGLMITTMAMEYNNQMRNDNVSAIIQPVFTDRLGENLKDTRLVCINNIIYLALSEEGTSNSPIKLDNVIFCYDVGNKSWYTFTHDETLNMPLGSDPDSIHHIFAVDSDQAQEGLGVITDKYIYLYPTTGEQISNTPVFDVIIETGELMPKEPMQALTYIQQLEFHFDYFISNPTNPPTILIEGTDHYGRSFSIEKQLNIDGGRGWHGKDEFTEQRNYVEWIRVDKYVESFRIRIKGKARFRLTHFNAKLYMQPDNTGTQWGFDARDHYQDAHGNTGRIHHYINDYNNLRRALVT